MTVISNNRRTDIEGLRGIAVLAVILFHSGFDFAAGGYVGVDIFFVLSGFLVAKTIKENIERNTFSLLKFYKRRFLRIVPASLVVVVIVGIIGLKVLLPEELKELSESIFSFLTLRSNAWAAGSVSYFGIDVAYKPLIHYWSLSVELQFYILFPIFLNYFLNRGLETELWIACFIVFLISFFYAMIYIGDDPNAGYFSTLMRVWQFCLGALICLPPNMRYITSLHSTVRDYLTGIGIIAIVVSISIFDQGSQFPGVWALIPCLGVALILIFGCNKGVSGKLLSIFWLRFIGAISFSLYLVHQPIFVFYKLFKSRELVSYEIVMIWGVIFVTACILFYTIEKRFMNNITYKSLLIGGALFVSSLYFSYGGVREKLPAFSLKSSTKKILDFRYDNNPRLHECRVDNKIIDPENACLYGDSKYPLVALWGDSHVDQIVTPLASAFETYGYSTLEFAIAGCLPLIGIEARNKKRHCKENSKVILDYLLKRTEIEHVFLHAYWIGYFDGDLVSSYTDNIEHVSNAFFIESFRNVVSRLISVGKKVHIIYPVPRISTNPPLYMARRELLSLDLDSTDIGLRKDEYQTQAKNSLLILDKVTAELDVTAIHIEKTLYDSKLSSYRVMLDGDLLYRDDNHLSVTGGKFISNTIATQVFGHRTRL